MPKRYDDKIPAEILIEKIVKNPQALLPLENLKVYVTRNGKLINDAKILTIEHLQPYQDFEVPRVHEIPENLPDEHNKLQSTTASGTKPKGNLILYTSRKDISTKLKYRWTITYKTNTEIVGTISMGDILSQWVPSSQFIYGEVKLDALSPEYVKLGRDRPNEGPLLDVLNAFVCEKIIELAKEINEKREQDLDDKILDEVHEENKLLDRWKNKILNSQLFRHYDI